MDRPPSWFDMFGDAATVELEPEPPTQPDMKNEFADEDRYAWQRRAIDEEPADRALLAQLDEQLAQGEPLSALPRIRAPRGTMLAPRSLDLDDEVTAVVSHPHGARGCDA